MCHAASKGKARTFDLYKVSHSSQCLVYLRPTLSVLSTRESLVNKRPLPTSQEKLHILKDDGLEGAGTKKSMLKPQVRLGHG